jgi:hypothetical protein
VVLRLRSVRSIVIAPARTGSERRRSKAVIPTDHTNRGIRSRDIFAARILIIVVIKLIAPKIDDAPAKCSEKMVRSTLAPECETFLDKGGYTVHPVPAPLSVSIPTVRRESEGGRSQNLMLFIRGKAISGAPNIIGTNQLPKPPIIIGITIKKIITNACAVTIVL